MCLSPIRILNPKKDFSKYNDKSYLNVPCNHCEECLNNKREGYEIRAYYEYLNCIEKGGSVYYYTLTFNNKFLPAICLPSAWSAQVPRVPCFSQEYIKRFFERFRKQLPFDTKFLVTSEYGGTTRRPHYHLLIYVFGNVSPMQIYDIVKSSWTYDAKSLGNVESGEYLGKVNSSAAISYVCKYISKFEGYSDVLSRFNNLYLNSTFYREFIFSHKPTEIDLKKEEFLKELRPKVHKSKHFGECAINYMSDIEKRLGTIKVSDIHKGFISRPLPLYLLRKLYYDVKFVNGNVTYILNPEGVKRKLALYDRMLNKRIDNFNYLDSWGSVPKELKPYIDEFTGVNLPTFKDVKNYVLNLCPSIRDLFSFDLVYRDRTIVPSVSFNPKKDLCNFLSPLTVDFFLPVLRDSKNLELFDSLPCFYNFSHCLGLLDIVKSFDKYQKYLKRYDKKVSSSRALSAVVRNPDKINNKFDPPKTLIQFSNLFNFSNPSFYVKSII